MSSTGHLTIVEKMLGLQVDDKGVTAFTAIIQVGAIAAVFVYFWKDIVNLVRAFFAGLQSSEARTNKDWRLAMCVIAGSIPIGIVGFGLKDVVSGDLRNLYVVAGALILWSAVMVYAEKRCKQSRHEGDVTVKDAVIIGLVQCLALVPGVSRSGATISAGLLRGIDRVTATRLSFFLSIPALTAAGIYEAVGEANAVSATVGWGQVAVGIAVSFAVAYTSIAWLPSPCHQPFHCRVCALPGFAWRGLNCRVGGGRPVSHLSRLRGYDFAHE